MRQKGWFEVDIEGKFEGLGTNRSLVSAMNSGLLAVHSYTRLSGEVKYDEDDQETKNWSDEMQIDA
ncbi:hypothetical protein CRYUN_Cryun01aG0222400 [Craigia yunnanensis]